MMQTTSISDISNRIAACRFCCDVPGTRPLPHEPRPVVVLSATARIAICGQAPGTRVHASGRPFTDPSGDRLRDWLSVSEEQFYDPSLFAIVPMGFCFPGLDAKGGDLPPRRECAKRWHHQVFRAMPQVQIVVAIGQYAQAWHLRDRRKKNLTATVANWREYLEPDDAGRIIFPTPHPSWRNNAWLKKNPWFQAELLPALRQMVRDHLT